MEVCTCFTASQWTLSKGATIYGKGNPLCALDLLWLRLKPPQPPISLFHVSKRMQDYAVFPCYRCYVDPKTLVPATFYFSSHSRKSFLCLLKKSSVLLPPLVRCAADYEIMLRGGWDSLLDGGGFGDSGRDARDETKQLDSLPRSLCFLL